MTLEINSTVEMSKIVYFLAVIPWLQSLLLLLKTVIENFLQLNFDRIRKDLVNKNGKRIKIKFEYLKN